MYPLFHYSLCFEKFIAEFLRGKAGCPFKKAVIIAAVGDSNLHHRAGYGGFRVHK